MPLKESEEILKVLPHNVWMYDLANSRKITPICCPPTGQTAHGKKLKINTEVGLKPFVVTKKLS